jgi:hypothetical protein
MTTILSRLLPGVLLFANWGFVAGSARGYFGRADPFWFLLLAMAWLIGCGIALWRAFNHTPPDRPHSVLSIIGIVVCTTAGLVLNIKTVGDIMKVI